jgi:hypothetical protein
MSSRSFSDRDKAKDVIQKTQKELRGSMGAMRERIAALSVSKGFTIPSVFTFSFRILQKIQTPYCFEDSSEK